MTGTSIIVSMGFTAVATAVGSKIASNLGEYDIAQYIKVGGISFCGITAITYVVKLLNIIKVM